MIPEKQYKPSYQQKTKHGSNKRRKSDGNITNN